MPKTLRQPTSSSSVARLLDFSAAARAVSSPVASDVPLASTSPEPRPARTVASGERPSIKRELILTATADETFHRLVEVYRRATGTRLTASHVARAVLKGVAHSMDQIEREATRLGRLKLPSNAAGKEPERERFEARIADAFLAGMGAAAALDREEE